MPSDERHPILGSDLTHAIEDLNTLGTDLKHDTTSVQFIVNWKTPTKQANSCWEVKVTTGDLSTLVAYFKLK